MSPARLADFPASLHQIPGAPYYDHEFGASSTVLTRETSTALSPGRYTIKFVIEDVADTLVDAALFIPTGSVKLFALHQGDYNGNGVVDAADYVVWRDNYQDPPLHPTFYNGDGNGDCMLYYDDYSLWRANYGETGNGDFSADFNRDGCVDLVDRGIWAAHYGMNECASRFEGDSDGDGDVDISDQVNWNEQEGQGSCGGNMAMMAGGGDSPELIRARLPKPRDMNGDGKLDKEDLPLFTEAVMKAIHGEKAAGDAGPQTDSAPAAEPTQVLPVPQPEPAALQEFTPE